MLLHIKSLLSNVTVCPVASKELASKKTLSKDIGAQPTGVPPLLSDQLLPSLQLPSLPIQYKSLATSALIDHPVLLPPSIALFTLNVAPPVALMSFKLT